MSLYPKSDSGGYYLPSLEGRVATVDQVLREQNVVGIYIASQAHRALCQHALNASSITPSPEGVIVLSPSRQLEPTVGEMDFYLPSNSEETEKTCFVSHQPTPVVLPVALTVEDIPCAPGLINPPRRFIQELLTWSRISRDCESRNEEIPTRLPWHHSVCTALRSFSLIPEPGIEHVELPWDTIGMRGLTSKQIQAVLDQYKIRPVREHDRYNRRARPYRGLVRT